MSRNNRLFSQKPRTKTGKKTTTPYPDTLTVERLSHEGRGVAKADGKTIFIEGALPGETVTFSITQQHRRYDEAVCTQVLSAAADRVKPGCAHYDQCGGCDLQHLAHDQQIKTKQALVLDQLQRLGGFQPITVTDPLISPEWEYRRSCRIGINQSAKDGRAIVGFRRRGSSRLTPVENCPVLAQPLNKLLQELPRVLETEDNFKTITHAELSLADNQGALTLRIKKPLSRSLGEQFRTLTQKNNFGLFVDNGSEIRPLSDNPELFYTVNCSGTAISFKPGDFIQVNAAVNELMIERAIDWLKLTKNDRVLDLFCGIGNFTLPVAPNVASIVGVEGVDDMVHRAGLNAAGNKLDNCEFYRADLSKDLSALPWYKQGFNKIILDPPRSGALEVIKQLNGHNPEMVLYISCNPAALSRDGAELLKQGYTAERFCVLDMFPHTSHVESMLLFVKPDVVKPDA